MIDGSGDVDEDAECDQGYSGNDGVGGGGLDGGVFGGAEFAQEEAEAADGEAYSHEAEAGADPGQESSFGGEVDAGILLDGLGWSRHGGIVRQGGAVVSCGFFVVSCGDLLVLRGMFWRWFADTRT